MRRVLSGGTILALMFAAGYWAARATMLPPTSTSANQNATTEYVVKNGVVHRELEFAARAQWPARPVGVNSRSGVVTRVFLKPGQLVSAGTRLYAIDERPVVVAQGRIPAFRDLREGTSGADVAQLQAFLASRSFYPYEVTGVFGSGTAAAVKSWQQTLGVQDDGVVGYGDLVFVPHLPARLLLTSDVTVGDQLSIGADTVMSLGAVPDFTVSLSADQADLVPLDATVVVRQGDGSWRGQIARSRTSADGGLELVLSGANGGALCASTCGRVPAEGATQYPVELTVVPRTRGPLVPAAALQVDAAGTAFVQTDSGQRVEVNILAADAGWSIIDGISAGDTLRLLEDTP